MAGILSGHEKLKQENLRPYCRKIVGNVNRMLNAGWTLHHWAADPVIWVPRELNAKADNICNKVMDDKAPYMYRHKDIRAIMQTKFNLKICTDGGVRGGRVSGTGWAVYAVQVDELGWEKRNVIIMEGGKHMDWGMSSLEVEIRALEEAMTHLVSLL